MVMDLFAHGSVLDVMRDKFPTGLDEDAVGAILYPTLCALQLRLISIVCVCVFDFLFPR
jgi:hypothetical protein